MDMKLRLVRAVCFFVAGMSCAAIAFLFSLVADVASAAEELAMSGAAHCALRV